MGSWFPFGSLPGIEKREAPLPRRQGNNPKRRIVPRSNIDPESLGRILSEARYTGSAHHKRSPADYGFHPPVNPRPHKSLCDGDRSIGLDEAKSLFREGIARGMISDFHMGGFPKYFWAVDAEGHAYEAKLGQGHGHYHGYELGNDDASMRQLVIEEWQARGPR